MRLTRAGWGVLAVGAATLVVARTFQVPQIWMIGVSLWAALATALVVVALRPSRLVVQRTVEPAELQAGDIAHMVLDLTVADRRRQPNAVLDVDGRRLRVPAMRAGSHHRVALDLATDRRGVRLLDPVSLHRGDALDLVRRTTTVSAAREVVVAPRTVPLDMARLGVGVLGAMLIQRARQFGVGEFEGLRQYVEGDDLRLVHWKASARSTDLMVKQFSLEGARRCTVVVDTTSRQHHDEFELAVSMAASLVRAAHRAELAVRLATTGGVDLGAGTRSDATTRALALATPSTAFALPRRDPSEGLGLVVCVTPDLASDLWRLRDLVTDPLMVTLAVTQRGERGANVIDVSSLEQFASGWNGLVSGSGWAP